MAEKIIVKKTGGNFYVKHDMVYREPLKIEYEDGTGTTTMGFQVCTSAPGIDPNDIAKALNLTKNAKTIEEYSAEMSSMGIYKGANRIAGLSYIGHKLAGEAGEFNEKLGKMLRDGPDWIDHTTPCRSIPIERRNGMLRELGDIVWYVNQATKELGSTFREVIEMNIAKLRDRKERGKLGGDGGDR